MKIELLAENTAFENIVWANLTITLYVNDDWFCNIYYLEGSSRPYYYEDDDGDDEEFETMKQVLHKFYSSIPNDHKIEMEVTS